MQIVDNKEASEPIKKQKYEKEDLRDPAANPIPDPLSSAYFFNSYPLLAYVIAL